MLCQLQIDPACGLTEKVRREFNAKEMASGRNLIFQSSLVIMFAIGINAELNQLFEVENYHPDCKKKNKV